MRTHAAFRIIDFPSRAVLDGLRTFDTFCGLLPNSSIHSLMKQYLTTFFALMFLTMQIHAEEVTASKVEAQSSTALKSQKEKASYSIGREMGSGMKEQKLDIDPELVVRGFREGFSGTKGLLSDVEAREVMEAFEKELEARMKKESLELPGKNKKEGEAFLAENKKREGIKTLAVKLSDGNTAELQYKVIREGSGATPKMDDKVKTHYRGTLIDGTEFDSSYKRGEPATFGLRQVIKGWQEALQLMKVGSKYQLYIPAELAYADKGAGRTIGPNATLIFELELLGIEKP